MVVVHLDLIDHLQKIPMYASIFISLEVDTILNSVTMVDVFLKAVLNLWERLMKLHQLQLTRTQVSNNA
jgi:hypothetical protein